MITDQLMTSLRDAIAAANSAGDLALDSGSIEIHLEPPRAKQFGDYTSNLAMTLAKAAQLPPREVAARIVKHLPVGQGPIERVEVAGPGFLNFYLKPDWLHETLVRVEAEDAAYGTNRSRIGEKTLIEFVSANPTGPISVVNGRAAALGDSLGNLLRACGAEVAREFYVNDALHSRQLDLLGDSLAMRYLEQLGHQIDYPKDDDTNEYVHGGATCACRQYHPFPKDGYHGEYLADMAAGIVAEFGNQFEEMADEERASRFRELAAARMVEQQRKDLEAFGVVYDVWFYESDLHKSGAVQRAIEEIRARGYAYEKDGALWLRTTALSRDDQDRVLVRSNEKETYVAADAAYHKDKFDRGFTRLINIWGADHHGYVERLKASIAALGYDPSKCEIILTQMVLLLRDGVPVKGSKRAGDIIPLADLVSEIGRDAARFFCLLNSYDTTFTFDVELAKKQNNDNPVFYAQYAHARCCNVLRRATETGVALAPAAAVNRSLLIHEKELDLLRKLADFPNEVRGAADLLAPHRLTAFVREIGQALHQFYEECPALKESVPADLRDARLALFNATRIVVRNLLSLLGVGAPEKM